MDKSVTGSITNIGFSILKPTQSSADVRLKEGDDQISYNGIHPDGAVIIFSSLGNGLRTVESEPTVSGKWFSVGLISIVYKMPSPCICLICV
ncbi:hypothetical protein G6053_01145 [Sphingobacterium sp. DR205]|nr:hypothetical protein G6053_01145 [Sphingobacterium sp. DR205]